MPFMTYDQILDLMESDLRGLDTLVQRQLDFVTKQSGSPITCRTCPNDSPGCCYQKVMVYVAEGLIIARRLKKDGRDTPEFREQLRVAGEEMEAINNDAWFHTERRPCVFLVDGRCSIYAVRPHACRTYNVVSQPECCQPGNTEGIAYVDTSHLDTYQAEQTATIHKTIGLKSGPGRAYVGALPRLVLLALIAQEQPTIGDFARVFRREPWPTLKELTSTSWISGANPFGERLVQIRKRPPA